MANCRVDFFEHRDDIQTHLVSYDVIYQIGALVTVGAFGVGTVIAFVCIAAIIYGLFRKASDPKAPIAVTTAEAAA